MFEVVIPANAGIHFDFAPGMAGRQAENRIKMDPSVRWDADLFFS
jgi:hypothetical protein